MFENQARKELESENCPPCYPPHLDILLQNIPEEYRLIVSYWQSFPGTGDVVLRAQLSDWRKFCVFQERVRAYYQNKPFSNFVNVVRDLKKELDDARKKADDAEAVRQELENSEWNLERHKVLLLWIEQKRRTMNSGYPTPAEEDKDDQDTAPKTVRSTSHSRPPDKASRGFRGPRQGQDHESQVEEAKHADPEAQGSRIRACHPGFRGHPTEQHFTGAKASRDKASTYERSDAIQPNSSAEGVQGKTISWCQGDITARDTTPRRQADPISRSSTIYAPAGPSATAACI